MKLRSVIFEENETTPTLEHVFYGATRAECRQVFLAHLATDAFLASAYSGEVTMDAFLDTTYSGEGIFYVDDGTEILLRVVEYWDPT